MRNGELQKPCTEKYPQSLRGVLGQILSSVLSKEQYAINLINLTESLPITLRLKFVSINVITQNRYTYVGYRLNNVQDCQVVVELEKKPCEY